MSTTYLLKSAARDTEGTEQSLRVIGERAAPEHMVIQIAIVGGASVQIQGRIARDAPWQSMGAAHSVSAIVHVKPVQFLRAIAKDVAANSNASVWAAWAW